RLLRAARHGYVDAGAVPVGREFAIARLGVRRQIDFELGVEVELPTIAEIAWFGSLERVVLARNRDWYSRDRHGQVVEAELEVAELQVAGDDHVPAGRAAVAAVVHASDLDAVGAVGQGGRVEPGQDSVVDRRIQDMGDLMNR